MSESADFSQLDDPAFLDERARLREQLEHVPQNATGRAGLETDLYLLRDQLQTVASSA